VIRNAKRLLEENDFWSEFWAETTFGRKRLLVGNDFWSETTFGRKRLLVGNTFWEKRGDPRVNQPMMSRAQKMVQLRAHLCMLISNPRKRSDKVVDGIVKVMRKLKCEHINALCTAALFHSVQKDIQPLHVAAILTVLCRHMKSQRICRLALRILVVQATNPTEKTSVEVSECLSKMIKMHWGDSMVQEYAPRALLATSHPNKLTHHGEVDRMRIKNAVVEAAGAETFVYFEIGGRAWNEFVMESLPHLRPKIQSS